MRCLIENVMTIRAGTTMLRVFALVLASTGLSTPLWAFEEPDIVSRTWQYDFSHAPPRPIAVHGIGARVSWFWFITYKVINHTGDERLFVPEAIIYTDTGEIFPAGRNVPTAAFDAIQKRLENPLLESPAGVIGRLLQGADHAKEGVAIWPAATKDVDHITVFFSGLSGETQAIPHPLSGKRVVLRKTLMIDYDLPGTSQRIQSQPVIFKGQKWVMR